MFTNLKPYPEYVNTGIHSFGRLPVGWESSRLRGVSELLVSNVDKLTHEHEKPVRLCNYVDVYKNEFIVDRPGYMKASASIDELRRFRVRVDDVAITKDSESWTDIGIPAYVAQEADDLVCGYHLGLLRTRKNVLSGAYLFRALQVSAIATQFHVAAGGVTRYGLSQDDILSARVPIPGLDEQAAIVKYVAHANARISRAIYTKRKMIELLKERQQAVIDQLVTRGLDSSVPLKDSGVPSLGALPAHWAIRRLDSAAKIRSETGRPDLDLLSVYLGRGVIPYGEGKKRVHAPSLDLSAYQVVCPGDLVLNNQQAWRGSVGVSAYHGIISPAYVVLSLAEVILPAYGRYLFPSRSMVDQFLVASKGVGDIQRQLHLPYLKNVQVPIPPVDEQAAIVDAIARRSRRDSIALELAERERELLREFQARLTTDVVTGRLDVREVAARMPELDPDVFSDAATQEEDDLDPEASERLEEADA